MLYEPQYCCYPTVTELSRSKECWSSRSHINVSFLTFCTRILTAPFTLAGFVRTSKINIDTRKKGRELSRQKNVVSGRSSTVNAVEPEALRRICFLSALLYITCCSELYFSTCSNSSAVSSILQQFLIKAPSTRILKWPFMHYKSMFNLLLLYCNRRKQWWSSRPLLEPSVHYVLTTPCTLSCNFPR